MDPPRSILYVLKIEVARNESLYTFGLIFVTLVGFPTNAHQIYGWLSGKMVVKSILSLRHDMYHAIPLKSETSNVPEEAGQQCSISI